MWKLQSRDKHSSNWWDYGHYVYPTKKDAMQEIRHIKKTTNDIDLRVVPYVGKVVLCN